MRRCLASSFILALACEVAAAQPRPMSAAAKAELDRGRARYATHDYAGAITAYDTGYSIDPHPDFMYAKAQAQRLGGDCRGAITSYNAFLSSSPPQSEADLAKQNIAKCEALLAASSPQAPAEPPVTQPTTPPVVTKPEEPPAPPPVQQPHDEGSPWWHDTLGLSLATGSLISFGVSIGFTIQARSESDDLAIAPDLASWLNTRDAWDRDRIIAGVTAGAGVVLAGLAIWRFATHHDSPTKVTAHVGHTRGATLVGLEGRW